MTRMLLSALLVLLFLSGQAEAFTITGSGGGSSLTIGTSTGNARDGGLAVAAEAAALSAGQNAQSSANTIAALFASSIAPGVALQCNNYNGSGQCGIQAPLPLTIYNVSGSSSPFSLMQLVKDDGAATSSLTTQGIQLTTQVGAGESGEQDGIQSTTNVYSTQGNSEIALAGRYIVNKFYGSNVPILPFLIQTADQTGQPNNAGAGNGSEVSLEDDISAAGIDGSANTSTWGGVGNRKMFHLIFGVNAPMAIALNGQISGTALSLSPAPRATLEPGSVITGSGVTGGTTIVSGSGASYVVTPSQTVAVPGGETMSSQPPTATSAEFSSGFIMGLSGNATVDQAYGFASGFQGYDAFDCDNFGLPAGATVPAKCLAMTSNAGIEFADDLASTPSLKSPAQRQLSYNSASAQLQYYINGPGVVVAVTDAGLLKALDGLTSIGPFTETGNATVSGTFGVTGASTLGAESVTSLSDTGTLGVTGASTLAGVSATSLTDSGTMGVTGTLTASSISAASETLSGTFGVTGASTFTSLSTTGAATIGTTLGVTGATTLSSLSTTGSVSVGTTLAVTGTSVFTGNLTVNGISAGGGYAGTNGTFSGTMSITGSTSLSTINGTGTSTIAAGAGAGTSPTVTLPMAHSFDGQISVLTGTSPTASAVIGTITFAKVYSIAASCTLTAANAAAAALSGASGLYVTATTTTFALNSGPTALAASTTYLWNYHCAD